MRRGVQVPQRGASDGAVAIRSRPRARRLQVWLGDRKSVV